MLVGLAQLAGRYLPVPDRRGLPDAGPGTTWSLFAHTYRWDSRWYGELVQHGYASDFEQVRAFYPVFPGAVWLVHTAGFGLLDVLAAGFVVNLVSTWLAAVALLKIGRHFFPERGARLVVVAFLTAPTAYFLQSFYTEAIFCALGFWAYLFALRRQWHWMGLALIPLTATRITAALFVGLCFLEFWRSKEWKLRGLVSWPVLWFPAAFLGLGAHLLQMKLVTGNAMAGFDPAMMEKYWSYHRLNPNVVSTGWITTKTALRSMFGDLPLDQGYLINVVLPFIGLALLFVSSVYVLVALRWKGVPLGVFGFASMVLLTINGNVISVHRYLLPCLVMYVALILVGERRPKLRYGVNLLLYVNSLICAVLAICFAGGAWTG